MTWPSFFDFPQSSVPSRVFGSFRCILCKASNNFVTLGCDMPMHIPLVCDVGLFSINHASINYEINFQILQKPGKLSGSIDSNCISRMWCTRLNLQRPNPLTSRLSVTKGTLYLAMYIYIYMLILSYRSVAAFHYVLPLQSTLMRTARFQTGLCFPWASGGRDWKWTGRPHLSCYYTPCYTVVIGYAIFSHFS